jgi:hypothetical protein
MHKHHHHHHDEEWEAGDARFGGPEGEPGWGPPPGYGWGGRPASKEAPPPGAFRHGGGFGRGFGFSPWMFHRGFGPWMFHGRRGPFGRGFGPDWGGPGPGFRGWGGPGPGFHGWHGPEDEGEWRGPQFRGGWGHHGHPGHHGHHGRHGGPDVAWQIARLEQAQAFLEQRLADVKTALEHLRAQQQQQDQPPTGGTDRPTVHL